MAQFQLLELSNLSSRNWNLVVHIPTSRCFGSKIDRATVLRRSDHTCWRQTEVNVSVVIMLRRKVIQIMRRIRRRTCAAHFDGLQPKSANLPDGSTALPWPQSQVSEESPRSHPVPGLNSQRCERFSVKYGNDMTRANATCEVDSVGGRLRDSSHKAVFCEQIVRTTRCNW